LDLSFTSWNAKIDAHTIGNSGFENSHVELANLWSTNSSTSAGGTPSNNYIDIDTTWNSILRQAPAATGTTGKDLMIASGSGTLLGDNGNDVLVASGAGNTLNGGAGNDLLLGGSGSDTLIGGSGNDIVAGGAGPDTFKFAELGTANIDTIADYNFAEGDKIDVSALLDSVFGSGALESNYIHLTSSLTNPADLVLQVDTGGTGDFTGGTHDVVTLVGINTVGADPIRVFFAGHDYLLTA